MIFKDILKELWVTKPYKVIGIGAAKVENLTPHAMRQRRKHTDAENFINLAINLCLEESLSILAQASLALANRLIKIALDEKKGAHFFSSIQVVFSIIQSELIF